MSRSGYSEDCEFLNLYRANVDRTIAGKRGQAFLHEMAAALDAMPVKELIAGELVSEEGECCALGSVALARGKDVSQVDGSEPDDVAAVFGITRLLVADVAYENDDGDRNFGRSHETPAARWVRMRKWVAEQLESDDPKEPAAPGKDKP